MTDRREWVVACSTDDIEEEDVIRFDHGSATFAVYRIGGNFHATDGWCTHEQAHLADGFVLGNVIECPRHQGRFDIATGKPLCAPVCERLQTYPVRVEGGSVLIGIPAEGSR
ncbi:MAG TPA: non-heme iron oxygenase ferredoxin subunit [Trinickia sp.]|nr:non-heme iron oxygenase ferredoxin subunit [Trinickia sp.]